VDYYTQIRILMFNRVYLILRQQVMNEMQLSSSIFLLFSFHDNCNML
jgi:hypothetical protein